ncbi:hypothetical protein DFH07DRAFT_784199 [Mycena maculata]|uniref:Uncharacterized protein n=1 Tax=Mycena maculata TaxID=230809 RepID=A0AAD7HHZ4_9AGAR|nr:hypothetical protein DFH07DRAFT_784199 [Mycena maculata]
MRAGISSCKLRKGEWRKREEGATRRESDRFTESKYTAPPRARNTLGFVVDLNHGEQRLEHVLFFTQYKRTNILATELSSHPTLPPGEFIPNRYIVMLKSPEQRDDHIEQLKARVEDESLLELKIRNSGKMYGVTLPSEVLEWVKSREEVASVSQDRKAKLS